MDYSHRDYDTSPSYSNAHIVTYEHTETYTYTETYIPPKQDHKPMGPVESVIMVLILISLYLVPFIYLAYHI